MSPQPAAIVLAAGASTRLGQPKQLIRIDGESLLRRTARLAAETACLPIFIVLGYEAGRMIPELAGLHVHPLVNEAWSEGMGSSLRCGAQALSRLNPQPSAALLLVCDQPRLSAAHLHALLARQAETGAAITASGYAGRAGVPAVFAASLFPELLLAQGDRGARDLIRSYAQPLETLPWSDGELDLDLPDDLERVAPVSRTPAPKESAS